MNIDTITNVIITALYILIIIYGITAPILINNNLNRKNDLEIAKMEMSMVPNKEDFNIIDLMITEEVNKYHIIINEPNRVEYMSDENIVDMERYILDKVLSNMSPINLQRLKYVYIPDKLEDIIYEKVQLAVISYSSDLNTTNKPV